METTAAGKPTVTAHRTTAVHAPTAPANWRADSDLDRLKGYQRGAVDYISVPIIPELLRAKVTVFAELHRRANQLEALNRELEGRVAERTEELNQRAEALQAARKDAELASWLQQHCAQQAEVRRKLRQITAPAGLMEQIVSEHNSRENPLGRGPLHGHVYPTFRHLGRPNLVCRVPDPEPIERIQTARESHSLPSHWAGPSAILERSGPELPGIERAASVFCRGLRG